MTKSFIGSQKQESPDLDLVVVGINTVTYSAVLFRAGCVARTSQIAADMLGARALPARKISRRLRQRIYGMDH